MENKSGLINTDQRLGRRTHHVLIFSAHFLTVWHTKSLTFVLELANEVDFISMISFSLFGDTSGVCLRQLKTCFGIALVFLYNRFSRSFKLYKKTNKIKPK
jgi:hypothetical protein